MAYLMENVEHIKHMSSTYMMEGIPPMSSYFLLFLPWTKYCLKCDIKAFDLG